MTLIATFFLLTYVNILNGFTRDEITIMARAYAHIESYRNYELDYRTDLVAYNRAEREIERQAERKDSQVADRHKLVETKHDLEHTVAHLAVATVCQKMIVNASADSWLSTESNNSLIWDENKSLGASERQEQQVLLDANKQNIDHNKLVKIAAHVCTTYKNKLNLDSAFVKKMEALSAPNISQDQVADCVLSPDSLCGSAQLALSPATISFLQRQQIRENFFSQPIFNVRQNCQLGLIVGHLNELSHFSTLVDNRDMALNNLVSESMVFSCFANHANQENLISTSELLLDVGKQLLAFGKGVVKSGLYNMVAKYDLRNYAATGHLIQDILVGAIRFWGSNKKLEIGIMLQNQDLIDEAYQEQDSSKENWHKIYQGVRNTYKNSTKTEVCESAGSLATDAFFMIRGDLLTPMLQRTGSLVRLGKCRSLFFDKFSQYTNKAKHSFKQLCDRLRRKTVPQLAGITEELAKSEGLLAESAQILNQDAQLLTPCADAAKLARLAEFEAGLAELIAKYGEQIVRDAAEAFKLTNYKVEKIGVQDSVSQIDLCCTKIKKIIDGDVRYRGFIRDPAKGNAVTMGAIEEGLVARTAEEMGIYKKLTRSVDPAYDFIDELGNKIDIKSLVSKHVDDKNIATYLNDYMDAVRREILLGEHIIFDLSRAEERHIDKLKSIIDLTLNEIEKSRIKFVDYNKL